MKSKSWLLALASILTLVITIEILRPRAGAVAETVPLNQGALATALAEAGATLVQGRPGVSPAGWDLLGQITLEEVETNGRWAVRKTFPPELEAQAQGFRITGYYVPIEAQAYVTSFILVPDPADCPFCGNGGYGPTLEVAMSRPVPDLPEGSEVTVEGRLNFDTSDETYRSVFLTDGRLVD